MTRLPAETRLAASRRRGIGAGRLRARLYGLAMLLPPPNASGASALVFWPPMLATMGEGEASDLHRHHASQWIVALSGSLRLSCAEGGGETRCDGVYAPSEHAFTEHVGAPLRHYLLWQKLGRAGAMLAEGATPSAAAAAAGFADAAHCTRTFRRMFGVTPGRVRSMRSRPTSSG